MSRKPYRYRECPDCEAVFAAGDLINHSFGAQWEDGGATRQCPSCGAVGTTSDFPIVEPEDLPDVAHLIWTQFD